MSASPRLCSPRLRSVSPVLDVAAKRLFSASADDRCLRNLTLKNDKAEDDPRARAVVQSRFASHRLSQCRGKLATVAGHLTAASKVGTPCRVEVARLLQELAWLLADYVSLPSPRSLRSPRSARRDGSFRDVAGSVWLEKAHQSARACALAWVYLSTLLRPCSRCRSRDA
ncbi:unnamed protein product [Symbiodinium microadriaticum]|nr:unnamed protein product [Symbiodinium microadriaticum]CAE7885428.1 unnamed protein product [Symbiodinium sp. KB8]